MGIKYCVPQTVHMDTTPEKRMKFAEVIIRKCDEVSALTNDLFLHALSDMDKLEMNMHEVPLTIFCRQSTAHRIAAIKRPPVVRPEVLHFFAFLQSAYFTARPAYPPAACAPASERRRPP